MKIINVIHMDSSELWFLGVIQSPGCNNLCLQSMAGGCSKKRRRAGGNKGWIDITQADLLECAHDAE
ncbi:hypothetical protein [Photobacterium halotolerans]|uniref:Uncharacterized protein n=1 Tax=Photobacterium halotolerans TaxID=265726 RepID=A0A7X5AT95_9GAMM|nr:hypothetical protein [Photobacterium halotolerans]NAW65627.1 hypothetical protein [Photobacterium halotolerans]NAW85147.1 hypothetical protein [Photobacterium halotolerans]